MSLDAIIALSPEAVIILTATLIYLLGAFAPGRHCARLAMFGLLAAAVALYLEYTRRFWPAGSAAPLETVAVVGPLSIDLFGQYVRWLALLVGTLLAFMAQRPSSTTPAAEYIGTLLMAVAGTMIVASARELGLMFLGLELVSVPTYIVLYLGSRGQASQEATAKYFFLSILSSSLFLFGLTYLYGLSGHTDLAQIRATLAGLKESHESLAAVGMFGRLALVFIFAGLAFRITAVPFHFYAPDVFQGTTNANAALLSVLPKIVGFTALVRIVGYSMPGYETLAWRVAIVLAVLTMTLGNILALWQSNVRRMLAYSSIAHAGYMLIGIAVALALQTDTGTTGVDAFTGVGATFFYLALYSIATAGAFAGLTALGEPDKQVDLLDDLAGAGRNHPWIAGGIAIFMFSLAGLPPLAGFWGKLALFFSALGVEGESPEVSSLRKWFLALAVITAINAAIAAAYYLRIIGTMYFRSPLSTLAGQGGRGARVAVFASVLLVLGLGFFPGKVQRGANSAARSLVPPPAATAAAQAMLPQVTTQQVVTVTPATSVTDTDADK